MRSGRVCGPCEHGSLDANRNRGCRQLVEAADTCGRRLGLRPRDDDQDCCGQGGCPHRPGGRLGGHLHGQQDNSDHAASDNKPGWLEHTRGGSEDASWRIAGANRCAGCCGRGSLQGKRRARTAGGGSGRLVPEEVDVIGRTSPEIRRNGRYVCGGSPERPKFGP